MLVWIIRGCQLLDNCSWTELDNLNRNLATVKENNLQNVEADEQIFLPLTVLGKKSIPSIDKRPDSNRVTSGKEKSYANKHRRATLTIFFYFHRHVSVIIRVNECTSK